MEMTAATITPKVTVLIPPAVEPEEPPINIRMAVSAFDWLVMLACAVALSFVVSTVLNRRGSMITTALLRAVPEAPQDKLHPEDRPLDLTRADVLVMGTGLFRAEDPKAVVQSVMGA